jgi:hypothetical protein
MAASRPPWPIFVMKLLSNLLLLLAPLTALAAGREPIETARLDDRVVYLVPVATNRVTTISFPGPIAAIDAAGVTTDPRVPGQFQLAHTKGTAFFSVRAVVPKATANVNVRWEKNTYVFQLEESPQPVFSLILEAKPGGGTVKPAPEVSPPRLLALLDKAKAFPLLKEQHPEAVADVDFATFEKQPRIMDFNDYEIRISEAFRFNAEDTIVFHLSLKNKTDAPIYYRPDSFALRTGSRVYPQSISDAAGLIPPKSEITSYVAITGTPDGGRNELSLKNEFTVLIDRIPAMPESSTTNQPVVKP